MKVQVENIGALQKKVNIEIPGTVVKSTFDKAFQGIQRQVTIKGFRKGKAPMNVIKGMYGDRVLQDVAQDLIQAHYPKALEAHNLDPISYPEFEFEDPSEAKDFSFTATFDTRPEVKLKKTEGLEVLREKADFDDSKINEVLENIRKSRAQLVDVTEGRGAQMGDTAILNFEGFVEGKPLENGTGTDFNLELGAKQFIEGFEEGMVGMKVGEEKTLHLKFPDPYHSADIAGKPVDFKVKLTALKTKELPELNDEMVKSLGGGVNDVESLKKTIRDDMEQSEKKRIEDAFKNRLLKALVDANPVDVPQSLLKEQKKSLVEDFKKRMSEQGMTEPDFKAYVEKWDKDFEKTAAEMIQSSFIIDALAKQNNLVCTKEDMDAKLAEYAKQTGIEETRIREWYSQPEQASRLTYMITEEKVVAHVMKSVTVKEVTKDKLKDETN